MIIKTDSDLKKAVEFVKNTEILAVDTETTGLNVRKDKVVGIGFSNQSFGFYAYQPNHISILLPLLNTKRLLFWNAYFDLEMIKSNFGIDMWNQLDTEVSLLAHTADENRMTYKLKDVAKDVLGADSTDEQKEVKESIKANGGKPKEFFKADLEVLGKYCVKDCLLTFKLYQHFYKMVKDDNLLDFFYKTEVMPLYVNVTRHMMSRGIKVNLPLAIKLNKDISNDINVLESSIQADLEPHLVEFKKWYMEKEFPVTRTGSFAQHLIKMANLPLPKTKMGKYSVAKSSLEKYSNHRFIKYILGDIYLTESEIETVQAELFKQSGEKYIFNLKSKHHLKKLFFEDLKLKPLSFTDKDQPQVDDDFLDHIKSEYKWVKKLQDYNKLTKLQSTYITRIIEESEDGIFYPAFFQFKTISGRYGSDIQQLPRVAEDDDDSLTPLVKGYRNQIRKLFTCRDGYKFIDADYESLEPHIFAHISGEDAIKSIFTKGDDFYSTIAIMTEKLDGVSANKKADNYLGKVNKLARQRSKAYSLGIPYGMESYALSKNLNISQDKADILVKGYLTGFPKLHNWMKDTDKQFEIRGEIRSQVGRIRRFKHEQAILKGFGWSLLNSLELYQTYAEVPEEYDKMKFLRSKVKNGLNNAKNFQIQSFAASITNKACIDINKYMEDNKIDGKVVAQIHDQIIVEVKEEFADHMKQKVQEIMEAAHAEKLTVKLKAPAEIGTNFADAH